MKGIQLKYEQIKEVSDSEANDSADVMYSDAESDEEAALEQYDDDDETSSDKNSPRATF